MNTKISCVIITLNEEKNLYRSLESVKWCDEIVVVDSGSTDKTLDICKEFNCRIFHNDFNGYGEQKRYGVSKASHDWVLNIDADEIVTNTLREEIKNQIPSENITTRGYFIPRSLIFLGKQFKYGRESKEYYLRLFDKNFGNFSSDKVHEKVELAGTTEKLNGILLHHSYQDIDQYFQKFNSYTTKAATTLFNNGNKGRSALIIILAFPVYFVKNYLIYRNFLNGVPGFLWSLFSSLYPIVKYFKLWNLWNSRRYR
jgi:glycosyltransferase involved in cell wall biosynthesis